MDKPEPYRGKKPYIFVSYAHADSARVWPIIARLQADGFRVWYDEGIAPGAEWADNIDQALLHCGYFFAFLSRNYLNSENCKDELHQSRNHIENRLLFYLDNVKLEGGIALRNSRLQAIHWYAYGADELEDAYAKLYTTQNLACCHETGRLPAPKAGPASASPPRPSETARPFDLRKWLLPLGLLLAVVFVGSIALSFLDRGGGPSDSPPASSESEGEQPTGGSSDVLPTGEAVALTSITEPVAQVGFSIQEDVTNTLGVTYKDAVVVSDWHGAPYVRYYVGDYSVVKGSFSIPNSVGEGSSFTLTVYLDENEGAPLPGYDRLELSRTSLERPFEFDVSGASFITFQLEVKSGGAGIMLTDTCLYEDAASVPAQTAGTGQSPAQDGLKLTSITAPVAQVGFSIQENVTNTLGVTYKDAVVVSDWHGAPYVRYYVGDYSVMKGSFSIPNSVGEGSSFTLTVYLDENEDAPLPEYDRLELTRTSLEQAFEFDVSDASFITFQLEVKSGGAGIMLTDTCLYEDAASVPAQTAGTGQSPAQDGLKLTSITEPVAQVGFRVQEDVTNTLGVTYKDAVVVSDWHGAPYVRYYVGDYSVMKGNFSIPRDSVGEGSSFTLTVYLDENEDAPLPGYDRLELSRTSLEQPFEFDVSGASFITFQLEIKSGDAGIMLTDCVLG